MEMNAVLGNGIRGLGDVNVAMRLSLVMGFDGF